MIADEAELRAHYRDPHPLVLAKDIGRIDDGARSFIEASPFVVVASSDGDRCDASPRGGPPGFVRVLDGGRLAWGDLAGNNRLDTMANVVNGGGIGLLFLVPGLDETLRVNGRGSISVEPDVLAACEVDGRTPKVAVVVDVEECYVHCAKAFRRAGMWDPATWPSADDRPRPECIIGEHVGIDAPPERVRADLEAGYQATMWEAGGT